MEGSTADEAVGPTAAAARTGHPPLAALLIPLFFFMAAFGMMRPNATVVALSGQVTIAGTASAWLGALAGQLLITGK